MDNIDFLYKITGLVAFLLGFINFIIVVVAKTFWNLTFKRVELKLDEVDKRTINEQKDNEAFRHKYKTTVEGLFELIKIKFEDMDKNFKNFEKLVEAQINLAISKNNEKK
jgi:hypothetical protein